VGSHQGHGLPFAGRTLSCLQKAELAAALATPPPTKYEPRPPERVRCADFGRARFVRQSPANVTASGAHVGPGTYHVRDMRPSPRACKIGGRPSPHLGVTAASPGPGAFDLPPPPQDPAFSFPRSDRGLGAGGGASRSRALSASGRFKKKGAVMAASPRRSSQ